MSSPEADLVVVRRNDELLRRLLDAPCVPEPLGTQGTFLRSLSRIPGRLPNKSTWRPEEV